MNARTFILLASLAVYSSFAQGTFQNLNFESAVLVPVPGDPDRVQFAPAFPGWTGYYGGSSLITEALYNERTAGGSFIDLFDRNYQDPFSSFYHPISNYTAVLQGNFASFDVDVSLAQTGLIPSNTLSLRFLGSSVRDNFFVRVGNQNVPFFPLQNFGNFKEYGADISAFAGQTAELRFTQGHGFTFGGDLLLDNISFSPVAIPEPSTWALFAVGSLALWCAAHRRRK